MFVDGLIFIRSLSHSTTQVDYRVMLGQICPVPATLGSTEPLFPARSADHRLFAGLKRAERRHIQGKIVLMVA
jgi:hypothetical protein